MSKAFTPIFVTLNQVLRRQVQSKADLLGLQSLAIITYADIAQYLGPARFYVLDEYHAQLFREDI
jgi:hypothetical protein